MNNVALTVCIVTYNQIKYIRQCLDSIVNQRTNYLYQVIISDDASTDGTSDICKEYERKYSFIKYVRHSINIGAFENFKYVHRQADTPYVSHCDADDYWHQDKLEKQISFLEENQECSAVYSNAMVINEDGSEYGVFNNVGNIPSKITKGFLLEKSNFLNTSSMLYRRSAIGMVFNCDDMIVDYHVHINLSSAGLLGYIKLPLSFYRRGADGSLCLSTPTVVGSLVHKARVDGLKGAKLSLVEYSKIKANVWYCKITAFLRKNQLSYLRCKEVDVLIPKYSFFLASNFLFVEVFLFLNKKTKEVLSKNDQKVFCHR